MGNTDSSETDQYPPVVRDWYYRIFGEVLPDQNQPMMVRDSNNQFMYEELHELNNITQGGVHQSYPTFNHSDQSFHPRLAGFEDLVRSLHAMNLGTAAGNWNVSHGSSSSAVENQGNINPNQMSYEELQRLQENVGSESKGLPESLLSRLPSHKYKSVSSKGKGKAADKYIETIECVICKVDFKKGDRLITLPCTHQYHDHCIKKWLRNQKVCCICKHEVNLS